ncbi:MAG: hypothetical protein HY329_25325 [Chloroflexi bacterium]|nr:hypothetical protein [Chloroflexota bacterium]
MSTQRSVLPLVFGGLVLALLVLALLQGVLGISLGILLRIAGMSALLAGFLWWFRDWKATSGG